jgi:hypothetical protein
LFQKQLFVEHRKPKSSRVQIQVLSSSTFLGFLERGEDSYESCVQTLIKHDLVYAFWLKIFPITLGGGKRLFADGTIPGACKATESTVTSKGVIIVNYERAGAVPTGSL